MPNPYSKGLEYVPKIPKFLQQLSDKHVPKVEQPSFSDGDEDDNELLGEDAPQVVVLKKRRLTKEQASDALGVPLSKVSRGENNESIAGQPGREIDMADDEPSVDENGRLLFKKGIKTSAKSSKMQSIDRSDTKNRDAAITSDEPAQKKTKRTNKGKSKVPLSFDIQD